MLTVTLTRYDIFVWLCIISLVFSFHIVTAAISTGRGGLVVIVTVTFKPSDDEDTGPLPSPEHLQVTAQSTGHVQLSWSPVAGAEVNNMLLSCLLCNIILVFVLPSGSVTNVLHSSHTGSIRYY